MFDLFVALFLMMLLVVVLQRARIFSTLSTRMQRIGGIALAWLISCTIPTMATLWAQVSGTPPPTAIESVIMTVIPFLVPFLVGLIKKVAPVFFADPKRKWMLPVSAAVFGIALQWISSLVAGIPVDTFKGVLLGGTGVLVREIADQISKARAATQG